MDHHLSFFQYHTSICQKAKAPFNSTSSTKNCSENKRGTCTHAIFLPKISIDIQHLSKLSQRRHRYRAWVIWIPVASCWFCCAPLLLHQKILLSPCRSFSLTYPLCCLAKIRSRISREEKLREGQERNPQIHTGNKRSSRWWWCARARETRGWGKRRRTRCCVNKSDGEESPPPVLALLLRRTLMQPEERADSRVRVRTEIAYLCGRKREREWGGKRRAHRRQIAGEARTEERLGADGGVLERWRQGKEEAATGISRSPGCDNARWGV